MTRRETSMFSGKKTLSLVLIGVVCLVTAYFLPTVRGAETFPTHPIEVIVPTPPGGGVDLSTRVLVQVTEQFVGQKLVVVNKPGGGGSVGVSLLTQAKPDGYTIASVWSGPMVLVPQAVAVPYSVDDYAPVTLLTLSPYIYCVKSDFPAANGKAFIEVLKNNPGKYTYGGDGIGGGAHMFAERIFKPFGVKARLVPFGGAGETLQNFLGGFVDIYSGAPATILPYVREGRAKCMMVSWNEKMSQFPTAATPADLGVPQSASVNVRGIIAPKGTPPDRLAILNKAFQQGARTSRFRFHSEKDGAKVVIGGPEEYRRMISTDFMAFEQVAKELGLKK
jgi:tripartite-type tricarboxylate transporter receptor subunit TctC